VLLFFAISGWSFVGLIAYHSAFSVDARRRREEERLTLNSLTWILELASFSKNAGTDLGADRQKGW
jgi:hypothetical protein